MEIAFSPYKIRSLIEIDAQLIYEYLQDFEIVKYLATVPSPYLLENAVSFIEFANHKENEKSEFHFAIADLTTNEMLGLIGVKEIDYLNGTCELGYWLGKKHQNKGIITKAIKKLSQFCFYDLDIKLIKAIVFESNEASKKVLKKCGFVDSGYSDKIYCNTILKEKMIEYLLIKESFVSRET